MQTNPFNEVFIKWEKVVKRYAFVLCYKNPVYILKAINILNVKIPAYLRPLSLCSLTYQRLINNIAEIQTHL